MENVRMVARRELTANMNLKKNWIFEKLTKFIRGTFPAKIQLVVGKEIGDKLPVGKNKKRRYLNFIKYLLSNFLII